MHPPHTFYVEAPVLGTEGEAFTRKIYTPNCAVWTYHVNRLGHLADTTGLPRERILWSIESRKRSGRRWHLEPAEKSSNINRSPIRGGEGLGILGKGKM